MRKGYKMNKTEINYRENEKLVEQKDENKNSKK